MTKDLSIVKSSWSDYYSLLLLLFGTAIFTYIIPSLKFLFFSILLIRFVYSKRDYLWLIFFFVYMQAPGSLFQKPFDNYVTITSTVGIAFTYIFILVAFIKYKVFFPSKNSLQEYKVAKPIFYYILFLILLSFIIGVDLRSLAFIFYVLCSCLFFYLIPYILNNRATVYKFISLLFFSTILLFIWQIHDIVFSKKIFQYFLVGSDELLRQFGARGNDFELNRVYYSASVSTLALFVSLFLLLKKEINHFSRNYLLLIAVVSFLSMFLTATRGYILMYLFCLLAFMFLSRASSISFTFIVVFLIMIITFLFPIFSDQLSQVYDRLFTLRSIYEGDLTAGGTLTRVTERAPKVMEQYLKSPIFGLGYSKIGTIFNDDHVGNHTLLLQGGVVGFVLWIFSFFASIKSISTRALKSSDKSKYFFTIAFLLSWWIAHSSSSAIFSYYLSPHMVFLFGFTLVFIHYELNISNK